EPPRYVPATTWVKSLSKRRMKPSEFWSGVTSNAPGVTGNPPYVYPATTAPPSGARLTAVADERSPPSISAEATSDCPSAASRDRYILNPGPTPVDPRAPGVTGKSSEDVLPLRTMVSSEAIPSRL